VAADFEGDSIFRADSGEAIDASENVDSAGIRFDPKHQGAVRDFPRSAQEKFATEFLMQSEQGTARGIEIHVAAGQGLVAFQGLSEAILVGECPDVYRVASHQNNGFLRLVADGP
jgi:hypothetical protein